MSLPFRDEKIERLAQKELHMTPAASIKARVIDLRSELIKREKSTAPPPQKTSLQSAPQSILKSATSAKAPPAPAAQSQPAKTVRISPPPLPPKPGKARQATSNQVTDQTANPLPNHTPNVPTTNKLSIAIQHYAESMKSDREQKSSDKACLLDDTDTVVPDELLPLKIEQDCEEHKHIQLEINKLRELYDNVDFLSDRKDITAQLDVAMEKRIMLAKRMARDGDKFAAFVARRTKEEDAALMEAGVVLAKWETQRERRIHELQAVQNIITIVAPSQ